MSPSAATKSKEVKVGFYIARYPVLRLLKLLYTSTSSGSIHVSENYSFTFPGVLNVLITYKGRSTDIYDAGRVPMKPNGFRLI